MSVEASDLCKACGFCCDGTLFGGVRLGEEEAAAALRVRLPVLRDDDGPTLGFPCAAHREVCSVYEDRPATCAAYRCELLDRLLSGEIDLAGATARVHRIRALIASIRPRLPDPSGRLWDEVHRLDEAPLAWKRANEELLLEIVTLRQTLARFMDARSGLAGAPPRAPSASLRAGITRPRSG